MWERTGLGSSGKFVKKACDYKRSPRPVVLKRGEDERRVVRPNALQLQSRRPYSPQWFGLSGQGLSPCGDGGAGDGRALER